MPIAVRLLQNRINHGPTKTNRLKTNILTVVANWSANCLGRCLLSHYLGMQMIIFKLQLLLEEQTTDILTPIKTKTERNRRSLKSTNMKP